MRVSETCAAAGLLCVLLAACVEHVGRPALYEKELLECNQRAQTLQDSIECEQKVRARYGRPLRDAGVD